MYVYASPQYEDCKWYNNTGVPAFILRPLIQPEKSGLKLKVVLKWRDTRAYILQI